MLSAFNRACSVLTTLWRSCRCLPHRHRRHTRCLSTIGGAGCRLSDGKISYCPGRPEKVLPNSQYHPISANIAQYPIPRYRYRSNPNTVFIYIMDGLCVCVCLSFSSGAFSAARTRPLSVLLASMGHNGVPHASSTNPHPFN